MINPATTSDATTTATIASFDCLSIIALRSGRHSDAIVKICHSIASGFVFKSMKKVSRR